MITHTVVDTFDKRRRGSGNQTTHTSKLILEQMQMKAERHTDGQADRTSYVQTISRQTGLEYRRTGVQDIIHATDTKQTDRHVGRS